MITRRVTFNIKDFLSDLKNALSERPDRVDDEIQRYKDYLDRASTDMRIKVMTYVNKHELVTDNKEVRSYINYVHSLKTRK